MGAVAQLHYDPEGDSLINRAALLGEENLSQGERERLAITLDNRRRRAARAAQQEERVDAIAALERRVSDTEKQGHWAREILPEAIGEVIAEAKQLAVGEAKKLQDELRGEINAKIDALFGGFERAVSELRGEDRRALFENLRETLNDAEVRIDAGLASALEKTWERTELEIALVRDELLNVIAEKKYGVFTDEAPKLELAEKAIATLRQRTTALEAEGARASQLAGVANQFAALEDAYRESTKKLTVRCATIGVLLRRQTARADELAGRVAALEAALGNN
jgi:hypothetical protein